MSNTTDDLNLGGHDTVTWVTETDETADLSCDDEDNGDINIDESAVAGENDSKEKIDVKLESGLEEFDSLLKALTIRIRIKQQYKHIHLNRLYIRIQEELIKCFDLKEDAIKDAIDHLNYNYRNVFRGKIPSEINYNDMNNCVGYLHRFASCHAALVQDEIRKVLLKPSIEVSHLLSLSEQLNIVCLGSGPGNDLMGFLNALHGHVKVNHLDITIVDKMPGWNNVFSQTVKLLKEKECTGCKVSSMFEETSHVTTSFIQADLVNTLTWSKGMEQKLAHADAILLVEVLSNIHEPENIYTLKNIVDRMKPRALLFFIDCPKIPEGIFEMNTSLRSIFQKDVTRFDFDCKEIRYSHYNITSCQAAVSVLGLLNPNKELPDFHDKTEWPKLK